jgi:myosin heavy subunit
MAGNQVTPDDLISLNELSNETILKVLSARFQQKTIYVSVLKSYPVQ